MPATPKSAFPKPAAVLPGEADVLANVLADLSDHDAKLVYADWLEERDDKRGPLLREFITAYRAGRELPDITSAPEPWRDVVGLTLIEKAKEEFANRTDTFLRLARPALRVQIEPTPDEKIPIGDSKYGGLPDMPSEVEWPTWEPGEYGTHSFIAQINLTDLEQSVVARELPSTGLLSFFWERSATMPECVGGWRVFHFLDVSRLSRRGLPSSLSPYGQNRPHTITFTEILTLPDDRNSPVSRELGLSDEEDDSYSALSSRYFESYLLGHPRTIHFDVEGEESRLLLQLSFGNVLYFTIPKGDLREQRFDRVGFGWER
jgi:uncharacterized protein (TIGR02996 family)